jgi:sugar lactone lactonase YvrE
MFLIDGGNNRILRINRTGRASQSLAGFEDTGGLVKEPVNFCIGPEDRLYVADAAAGEIVVFDYYGNYAGGAGGGTLRRPMGVTVDGRGNIVVADAGLRKILVFSPEGEVLKTVGPALLELGAEFREPVDVAFAGSLMYVLDRAAGTIFIFRVQYE